MIRNTKSGNRYTAIVSQDFGDNKYSKTIRVTTHTTIVSQDFGESKYSKNIRVTTQILQLCHKFLEGISTAKIAG